MECLDHTSIEGFFYSSTKMRTFTYTKIGSVSQFKLKCDTGPI